MDSGEFQEDIVASLKKEGINTTLGSFRNLLGRARKKRKEIPGKAASTNRTQTADAKTEVAVSTKPTPLKVKAPEKRTIDSPHDLKLARMSETRLDPEELARQFESSKRKQK